MGNAVFIKLTDHIWQGDEIANKADRVGTL